MAATRDRVLVRPCIVCGSDFETPRSRGRLRRCSECVAAGRAICGSCGTEVPPIPGKNRSLVRCADCRARRKSAGVAKTRTLSCRGGATPWKRREHARGCAGEKTYLVTEARKLKTLDGEASTYECRACQALEGLITRKVAEMARLGYRRPGSYAEFKEQLAEHVGRSGAWRAAQGKPGVPPLERLQSARRTGHRPSTTRALTLMLNAWTGDGPPRWEVWACDWCGKLLLNPTAPTARPATLHRGCYTEARRTPEARAWRRNRSGAFARGRTRGQVDRLFEATIPLPSDRRSRKRPEHLTRNFGWAVRHHLGGESLTEIAQADRFDRTVVSKAVAAIIEALPEPDTCDVRLRRYVIALRAAIAGDLADDVAEIRRRRVAVRTA